jgi:hypothetical protein
VKGKKTHCAKLSNGIHTGQSNSYKDILFTNEQYGPVNLIVWWGKKRCDLSLFQFGLRYLKHILNEGLKIPVDFCLSPQE